MTTITDRIVGLNGFVGFKPPVRVATTANITLSGEQTIDGVAVVSGDRVLVKDQTDSTENGIWVAATGAWSRATDFNGARDATQGTQVFVAAGSAHARQTFSLTTSSPVIGTSSLSFAAAGPLTTVQVGTTSRLLTEKLGDVLDARDYGVVADGTTDDSAALQAAIDALSPFDRLNIPANVWLETAGITVTTADIHLHFEGRVRISENIAATTTVDGLTARIGFHFKAADRIKITGSPRFVGISADMDLNILALTVFDRCEEARCPAPFFVKQTALGRHVIGCDRSEFGDIVGDEIDGRQVYETGSAASRNTAGSVEVIAGCDTSSFGRCTGYNVDKPARYLSVIAIDGAVRQNRNLNIGPTSVFGIAGTDQGHALAIRNAKDVNCGPVTGRNAYSLVNVVSYENDTVEIDNVHIESVVGRNLDTAASADTLFYSVSSLGAPTIGRVSVGSIMGDAAGAAGIFVEAGHISIGSADLRGDAVRLVLGKFQNGVTAMDETDPSSLSPSSGESWVVAASAVGDWSGQDDNIATWSGSAWTFVEPNAGATVFDVNTQAFYKWSGSAWGVTTNPLRLSFGTLRVGDFGGADVPVDWGLGCEFHAERVEILNGPELGTPTAALRRRSTSAWFGPTGGVPYSIGSISYRQADGANDYPRVLLDQGVFGTSHLGHVDGTGSSAVVQIGGDDFTGVLHGRYLRATAPSSGTYAVGALVWNSGVAAGGSPAWSCTTAGTPGTWKAHANVAS